MNIGEIVTVVTYEPVDVEENAPVEEKRQEEELVPIN
jgi:hypothetical protein